MAAIAELFQYPIKSCRGTAVREALLEASGFRLDREWMVVDERGVFVAQRPGSSGVGVPKICFIEPSLKDDRLLVRAPGMDALEVPLASKGGRPRNVRVWRRELVASDEGDEAADWFTRYLSPFRPGSYRLVRMSRTAPADLGFVDDDAVLVISQASLDDLNRRLPQALPMDRFRPNIVLAGTRPYEEDELESFTIDGIPFAAGPHCTRCAITTTDQATATIGPEPLRTLATYRRAPEGVRFGRYFRPLGTGRIRVGARISKEVFAAKAA